MAYPDFMSVELRKISWGVASLNPEQATETDIETEPLVDDDKNTSVTESEQLFLNDTLGKIHFFF